MQGKHFNIHNSPFNNTTKSSLWAQSTTRCGPLTKQNKKFSKKNTQKSDENNEHKKTFSNIQEQQI